MKTFYSLSLLLLLGITTADLVRLPLKKIYKTKSDFQLDTISEENTEITLDEEAGALPLISDQGTVYVAIVGVGSNNQEFVVAVDTGSGDLWIPDVSLAAEYPQLDTFNCSNSTTCTAFPSESQTVAYGSGNIELFTITDQVNVGGIVIPDFTMSLATNLGDIPVIFDGIMGMSLGRDDDEFPTVFQSLISNKLIDDASFSIFVGTEQDTSGNYIGELIFGGYDPKYADGEFLFVKVLPITEEIPYWQAPMLAVGLGSSNLTAFSNNIGVFDSGTTLMLLPQAMLEELLEEIASRIEVSDSNGGLVVYCNAQDQLPPINVYFEGVALSIPPSSYLIPVDSQGDICTFGLDVQNDGSGDVILGDTFLKNYYTLFSASNHTVGFAKSILSNNGTAVEAGSTSVSSTSVKTSYGSNISWFMALIALVALVL